MSNIGRMVLATNYDIIIMISNELYVFYSVSSEKWIDFNNNDPTIVDDWINYHDYKELS